MTVHEWRFCRWLLTMIRYAEQAIRDERLTGTTAYHDAIADTILWRIDE
jgi:hypothetical protein